MMVACNIPVAKLRRPEFRQFVQKALSNLASATPFLYGAPRALTTLATSASASASNPLAPVSHIADLRTKQKKAEQLQTEKQLGEDEEVAPPSPPNEEEEEEDESANEASPSLFQKKVGKILTKLRIISRLTAPRAELDDNKDGDEEIQKGELGEVDVELVDDAKSKENDTEVLPTFQKVIYTDSRQGKPIRYTLDLNEKLTEEEDGGSEPQKAMGRLEQVGVFFAELVGSIVGLVYGAAAQINNSVQGTNASHNGSI
ncbi:hypothetical protein NQ318_001916 [Aromia moschata]|uniref:Uncharacterized protein n=1 Tax=Aromia moschata TaxID=1265417 RepID=A0AAV8Z359_9CUCU|nr:hypothetical protein NQ318_001916 [Aromia moschata]